MTLELPEWGRGPVLREFRAVGVLPGLPGEWVLASAVLLLDRGHTSKVRRGLGRGVIQAWAGRQAAWLRGAELAHGCEACGSPEHGRPRLHKDGHELPARLSYGRARLPGSLLGLPESERERWAALAVLAFRPDAGDLPAGFGIGVDLEPASRRAEMSGQEWKSFAYSAAERKRLERLAMTAGAEAESAEALRLWTLKEAYVKAVGTGLRAEPREIDTAAWSRRPGSAEGCLTGTPA